MDQLRFREFLLLKKGANDVSYLLTVWKSNVDEIPVVNHKDKVVPDSYLISNFFSGVVDGAHDSNEHVEKSNRQNHN